MEIAEKIRSNQDHAGMLRRTLERIVQLYTDKSHFIYELLQNAEDARAHEICFIQYEDRLEVMHDGRPFTEENLLALCDVGQSDKIKDLNQIGEFGVGFKSVFSICDHVLLYSNPGESSLSDNCQPYALDIQDFTNPVDIDPVEIPSPYTTCFVFPYSVGLSYSGYTDLHTLIAKLSDRLENLGVTTLLFLNSLEVIRYEIYLPEKECSGEYQLEKTKISKNCTRVSAMEIETAAGETNNSQNQISYLKFSRSIDREITNRTIDIAFAIETDKNGKERFVKAKDPYVSVYFPTETESKLDFIIQGPFRTTPNRGSVPADDVENIQLAKKAASLLRESIVELMVCNLITLDLISVLPIDRDQFEINSLFLPLYDETLDLFKSRPFIPNKNGKKYVHASDALIARNKTLTEVFSSWDLSKLIRNGKKYEWLSTALTETGSYRDVYRFFVNELGIKVIRPEDLSSYFTRNREFLKSKDDNWLVNLYHLYEGIPNIFRKSASDNMLEVPFVRTQRKEIISPYRKTEAGYLPNVYLPSGQSKIPNINYIHPYLYKKCKSFFEDVLQLKAPDEFEAFISYLKKQYPVNDFNHEDHIHDLQKIVHYLSTTAHAMETRAVINRYFPLKCIQNGNSVFTTMNNQSIFFPQSESGLLLVEYFKHIDDNILFIDLSYYQESGITYRDLRLLGVTDSILTGDFETSGEYDRGNLTGNLPHWETTGSFRWNLSLMRLEDVLLYISTHPKSSNSFVKSQIIYRLLVDHKDKLCGTVYIGGSRVDNLYDESATIVKLLNRKDGGKRLSSWNGTWLFTKSYQLVSHKSISKYDLDTNLYGQPVDDPKFYELIGFKKSRADRMESIALEYDKYSEEEKQSFFEIELERRFGITVDQLNQEYGHGRNSAIRNTGYESEFEFPVSVVKNWDALKKHAVQAFSYATPLKYQRLVRSVRVSRSQDDIKAYLMNMYRINSTFKYACQLCHKPTSDIEACQLERKPDFELDPMNLCLCPSCAQKFRRIRNDIDQEEQLMSCILQLTETDINDTPQVSIPVRGGHLWFTQTHIAEIVELLSLKEQTSEAAKRNYTPIPTDTPKVTADTQDAPQGNTDAEESYRSDLAVYNEYLGKRVRHKTKKAFATVTEIDGEYIKLRFESGPDKGQEKKFSLNACIDNDWLEIAED